LRAPAFRLLLLCLLLATACSRVLGLEKTHVDMQTGNDGGADDADDEDLPTDEGPDEADMDDEHDAGPDADDGGSNEDDGGASEDIDAGSEEVPEEESTQRTFRALNPWPHFVLGICFTYSAAANSPERVLQAVFAEHVRELFKSAWGRHSGLTLFDAVSCAVQETSSFQLALHISDTAASHSELGFTGLWIQREVTLNRFEHDAGVLYTLGRALGFGHEFGRKLVGEEPCVVCEQHADCADDQRCMPSGFCGDLADHESIMGAPDRCGGVESMRRLTGWDVAGAQRAYGLKHEGSIVSPQGHCLNLANGLPTPGTPYVVHWCGGFDNDTFARAQAAGTNQLRMFVDGQQVCAAAASLPTGSSATGLVAASCDPSDPKQQVRFEGVELRGIGDLCISTQTASAGATAHIAQCGASELQQRWDLVDNSIRLTGSNNLCLAVEGGQAVLSAQLKLVTCNAAAVNQRFRIRDREIRYIDPEGDVLCFNSSGGEPSSWAQIVLWTGCGWQTENSRFHVSGPLRIGAGCFGLAGAEIAGQSAVVEPCNPDSPDQHWDYHF
jgi:hypothetical protein